MYLVAFSFFSILHLQAQDCQPSIPISSVLCARVYAITRHKRTDCRLGSDFVWFLMSFRGNQKAKRAYLVLKADVCFAKRMPDMAPGGSGIDDQCLLLSSIVHVLSKSIANWEREKIGPVLRIQTPKKKNKPSSTPEANRIEFVVTEIGF